MLDIHPMLQNVWEQVLHVTVVDAVCIDVSLGTWRAFSCGWDNDSHSSSKSRILWDKSGNKWQATCVTLPIKDMHVEHT